MATRKAGSGGHWVRDMNADEHEMADEDLAAWSRAAERAGDAATMLIADIARGKADYLDGLSAADIEESWPTVTDSSSGDEILNLARHGWRPAERIASTWGSPWPEDEGNE